MTSSSPELAGATGLAGVPAQLAILVVDDERRCLEANLSACRLLGLPRSAALGRTLDDFLASGMRKRLDHVWRAFREGGGHAGPFELSSQAAEAHEVHISVVANVLPGRHLLILSATESTPGEVEARTEPRPIREAAPPISTASRFARGGPTSREREVLTLLAAGATDEQIAEMLDLSPGDRADARSKREGQARGPDEGPGRGPGAPARDDQPQLTDLAGLSRRLAALLAPPRTRAVRAMTWGSYGFLVLGDRQLLAGEARRFPGVELGEDVIGHPFLGALGGRVVDTRAIARRRSPFGPRDRALGEQRRRCSAG